MACEIRAAAIGILADQVMHPITLAERLQQPLASVQAALREEWYAFRPVALAGCFGWALATSPPALAAQREAVARYTPSEYRVRARSATRSEQRRKVIKGMLTDTSALGRALHALGSGTIEELAAAAGCSQSTILQKASRHANYLEITRAPIKGPMGRTRMRVVGVALKGRVET